MAFLNQIIDTFSQVYKRLGLNLSPEKVLLAHEAYKGRLFEFSQKYAYGTARLEEGDQEAFRQLNALWKLAGLCLFSRPQEAAAFVPEYLRWLKFHLTDESTTVDFLLRSRLGTDTTDLYIQTLLRLIATRQLEQACLLLRHGVMEGDALFSSGERDYLQLALDRLLESPSIALILEDPLVLTEWIAENRAEFSVEPLSELERLTPILELLKGNIMHVSKGLKAAELLAAEFTLCHWPNSWEEIQALSSNCFPPAPAPPSTLSKFDQICLSLLGCNWSASYLLSIREGSKLVPLLRIFSFHLLDILWRAGLVPEEVHRKELHEYTEMLCDSKCDLSIILTYAEGLGKAATNLVDAVLNEIDVESLMAVNDSLEWVNYCKRFVVKQLQERAYKVWKSGEELLALKLAVQAQDSVLKAAIIQNALQRYAEGWDAPFSIDSLVELVDDDGKELIGHIRSIMEDSTDEASQFQAIQALVSSADLLPAAVAEAVLKRILLTKPELFPSNLLEFIDRHQRKWVLDANVLKKVRLRLIQGKL